MRTSRLAALLMCACSGAPVGPGAATARTDPAPPATTPARVERRISEECLATDDPRIGEAEARARAEAEAAFEEALRGRGLRRLALPEHTVELGQGLSPTRPPAPEDTLVERTIDGHRGTFVAGPSFWIGRATQPESWELARSDDDGAIYRVTRRPEPVVRVAPVCGCEPPDCSFGSPCPACHPTVQRFYGPLPPGTRYAGEVEVSYDAPLVERRFADGPCPRPCPPPPP